MHISDWKSIFTGTLNNPKSVIFKTFFHRGIMYPFTWSKNHHLTYQKANISCSRVLWRYLNKITQEDYPVKWFNDESIKRISRFRIKGLKRGLVPNIGNRLIEEGVIQENFTENKIVKITNDLFKIFHDSGIENKLVGHEKILANLIKEDKNAIASEVPVWSDTPEPITGHIDLIRIENDSIHIVDYKPEGRFMASIPQVAYYGYLIKKTLNLKNVLCSSFNKDTIWTYKPYQLLERTNEIVKSYVTNAKFDWQIFI